MPCFPLRALAVAFAILGTALPARADAPSRETIILLRHGEKPDGGLGQLACQGLNRALALPTVIAAKFGKPDAIFAPKTEPMLDDDGKTYDYIRPLATIEPTAIRYGMPVDTEFSVTQVDQLQAALEQPGLRNATVLVAWEHKLIEQLAQKLLTAHGAAADTVPKWHGSDFDSLYIIRIIRNGNGSSVSFEHGEEGLNGQPSACPR